MKPLWLRAVVRLGFGFGEGLDALHGAPVELHVGHFALALTNLKALTPKPFHLAQVAGVPRSE